MYEYCLLLFELGAGTEEGGAASHTLSEIESKPCSRQLAKQKDRWSQASSVRKLRRPEKERGFWTPQVALKRLQRPDKAIDSYLTVSENWQKGAILAHWKKKLSETRSWRNVCRKACKNACNKTIWTWRRRWKWRTDYTTCEIILTKSSILLITSIVLLI